MTIDWEAQRDAWGNPPVGGRNISTEAFLSMSDGEAKAFADYIEQAHRELPDMDRMAKTLRLDDSAGQIVMDFGCGFGMDALRLIQGGADVILCDLVESNVRAAARILRLHGYEPADCIVASPEHPFFPDATFDVFLANGVLHHTPHAREIARRAWSLCGEMRLMLYTEHAAARWSPGDFVRHMDAVGHYADWYDLGKIGLYFGGSLEDQCLAHEDFFRCVVLKDVKCTFS